MMSETNSSGTTSSLVEVRNLTVRFQTYAGDVRAVNGISFDVQKGEILGLVGETGCGKSVTGLSLLRLVPRPGEIIAGNIWYKNEDLVKRNTEDMLTIRGQKFAMVFQDPRASLNPVFTIGEQIITILSHHESLSGRAAKKRARKLLSDVELPDPEHILDSYPHELSGGMQQRVMIAIALSSGAELIIADEPTSSLDVTIQAQILDLLLDLQATLGLSVLMITHDLGVVAESCDRVMVLYAGNLVEVGPTKKIFNEPKHPYTRALLGAIPRPGSRGEPLPTIAGSVPSGMDPIAGCSFHPRCPEVMDICPQAEPALVEMTEGHKVACYLYHDQSLGEDIDSKNAN